jgi:transcriptional regulator with XRE-family HTH domain
MTISKIRIARAGCGLTQRKLAKKAFCSQSLISLIEQGEHEPDERLRKRIARALRQPAEILFEASPDIESGD